MWIVRVQLNKKDKLSQTMLYGPFETSAAAALYGARYKDQASAITLEFVNEVEE